VMSIEYTHPLHDGSGVDMVFRQLQLETPSLHDSRIADGSIQASLSSLPADRGLANSIAAEYMARVALSSAGQVPPLYDSDMSSDWQPSLTPDEHHMAAYETDAELEHHQHDAELQAFDASQCSFPVLVAHGKRLPLYNECACTQPTDASIQSPCNASWQLTVGRAQLDEPLKWIHIAMPTRQQLSQHQVIVRMDAVALCERGIKSHCRNVGAAGHAPCAIGSYGSGTVIAVSNGSEHTHSFRVGHRVYGRVANALAQYAVADVRQLAKCYASQSMDEAAACACMLAGNSSEAISSTTIAVKPHIHASYDFTPHAVNQALNDVKSHATTGVVIVRIAS